MVDREHHAESRMGINKAQVNVSGERSGTAPGQSCVTSVAAGRVDLSGVKGQKYSSTVSPPLYDETILTDYIVDVCIGCR